MSAPERTSEQVLKCSVASTSLAHEVEIARLSAAQKQAAEEASAAIAQQLNGPLTALLLYMGEIKLHSHQLSQAEGNRIYLQQVVENALAQTERVCAMIKLMAGPQQGAAAALGRKAGPETRAGPTGGGAGISNVMFSSEAGQKPLTRREREVLGLISEGRSNKQGALQMNISPRTFESHRAEAMRKLGVRNTAELVRSALLHRSAG
jgi:DNA-binding CsgD family transcriptional regulator